MEEFLIIRFSLSSINLIVVNVYSTQYMSVLRAGMLFTL